MKRKNMLISLGITVALAVLATGAAISAQDKYTLQVLNGLPFSDFRGYEDWQLVSVAQTEERLKVIVANPTMIAAYKAGVPGNGKPFPDGSKIAKIQWKPKKSTEAPFSVNVPDTFADLFLIEKDSKRFPDTGGWGYAQFDYDPKSDTFSPNKDGTPACGHTCHKAVKAKDYIFHPYQKR
jgi:Cytochrome P460